MKKILFAAVSALLITAFTVSSVAAYSSPFSLPEGKKPGEVNAAAEIAYSLREGGKYIYCNNPEQLYDYNIGKALIIENDLKGDVFFSNENRNLTGKKIYTGLQLRNNSGEDIKVTVKNVGYQLGIDWYGQVEWTDFFDTEFGLEKAGGYYAFSKVYSPVGFKETTYTVPNGKYIYVMGGTTADAYGNINVAKTADRYCTDGQVINGAVYFTVDGPDKGVSAAYVCYESAASPVTTDQQQGYIVERNGNSFGRQYLGSAPFICAEASIAWNIDDSFADGKALPIKYKVNYYTDPANYGVYGEYTGTPVTRNISGTVWYTHINSNNHSEYIGTDMMPFYCVTDSGESVVIDSKHNDGTGKPANIGNWMIVYEERLTFENSGDRARSFDLYMKNKGVMAVTVRDKNGNQIESHYHWDADTPVCSINVPGGKTRELYLEYVLLADSYGSVEHSVVAGAGYEEEEVTDFGNGDINGDDEIDAADYILVKRHIIGNKPLGDDKVKRADINGDGEVDAADYILIKRHIIGNKLIPGAKA